MLTGAAQDPERADEHGAAFAADVRALAGSLCRACGRAPCGHELVLSVLLGYRNAPRCAECLAVESRETRAAFCERILHWLRARDCYREAWERASAAEGSIDRLRPSCIFSVPVELLSAGAAASMDLPTTTELRHDADFDAGDMGCGELVLELRTRLRALPQGAVLCVTACDPAAPVDLPAWCGLTKNPLLAIRPPLYWIQRRKER